MFNTILIANRGEIACRVIRTAQKMGICTVAVYSNADVNSRHVQMADKAVNIGPAAATESYLNAAAIIQACRATGAEAIHPGYGFLSEDANFSEQLMDNGIQFIGPEPVAVRAMGDKITAKIIARKAGVNVIPGVDDFIESPAHAVELANSIGYPVMLKPTSAGGGKGMRLAYNDAECRDGFIRSASEAKAHFGDDRVFVEKYIDNPRHIEVQVLADKWDTVVHLGERECSLQRRHQKVIEEAPSSFLNDETRRNITAQAIALARAVDYVSAGTIEFVVDSEQNFYFLEMNTRLQVEHPVTEYVTGVDLVECMIRVAANERLDLKQSAITTAGWAVEARIYAEDPSRNFLPSTGRLIRYRPPTQSTSVRIDTGVDEGGEISIHYDPMIAKLIVHQNTREEAFALLAQSLDEFQVTGVITNIPFLQALTRDLSVLAGDMHTRYIESKFPDGYDPETARNATVVQAARIAAIAHYMNEQRSIDLHRDKKNHHWTPPIDWVVLSESEQFEFTIEETPNGHRLSSPGTEGIEVHHHWLPGQQLFHFTDTKEVQQCVQLIRIGIGYQVNFFGMRRLFKVLSPTAASYHQYMLKKQTTDVSLFLRSPMPGRLQELRVTEGQTVTAGETVAIIEAMKMENALRADHHRTIAKILVKVGDSVAADQPIVEFESEDDA